MTLKQTNQLLEDERQKKLRMPIITKIRTKDELVEIGNILHLLLMWIIIDDDVDKIKIENALKRYDSVMALERNENFNGLYIKSAYGSGNIFNARQLFDEKFYNREMVKGECYSNAIKIAFGFENDAGGIEIHSGIVYAFKLNYLHSVIEMENKILDFNYDVCMDKDLYYSLFNFEELKTIKDSWLKANFKNMNKSLLSSQMVFAPEESLKKLHEVTDDKTTGLE